MSDRDRLSWPDRIALTITWTILGAIGLLVLFGRWFK